MKGKWRVINWSMIWNGTQKKKNIQRNFLKHRIQEFWLFGYNIITTRRFWLELGTNLFGKYSKLNHNWQVKFLKIYCCFRLLIIFSINNDYNFLLV